MAVRANRKLVGQRLPVVGAAFLLLLALAAGTAAPAAEPAGSGAAAPNADDAAGAKTMYGLIGKVRAVAGQRDALAEILLEGTADMPGCLSYVVALDPADADVIWVTEVWDSEASHKASLSLPAVKDAIARGRPLITGFEQYVETVPLGGRGIVEEGK